MGTRKKSSKKDTVKVEIPQELHHAILQIQIDEGLDLEGACRKAAALCRKNTKIFDQAVERRAQSLSKSTYMSALNKSKEGIRQEVRTKEDNFRTHCKDCDELMYFSSNDENWSDARSILYKAFRTWKHTRHG